MGFDINYEQIAERIDKGLEIFGVKSVFNFFGVDKKKWLKQFDKTLIKPIYISPGTYLFPKK